MSEFLCGSFLIAPIIVPAVALATQLPRVSLHFNFPFVKSTFLSPALPLTFPSGKQTVAIKCVLSSLLETSLRWTGRALHSYMRGVGQLPLLGGYTQRLGKQKETLCIPGALFPSQMRTESPSHLSLMICLRSISVHRETTTTLSCHHNIAC